MPKSFNSIFVFDINGVLLKRVKERYERRIARNLKHIPIFSSKKEQVFLRPYLTELSNFFELNKDYCEYAFWTSAQEINAQRLYEHIQPYGFNKPKFIWNQSHCKVIGHNGKKPLFLKEINKVWNIYSEYNQKNVILIDDDDYKCDIKSNLIHIDTYDVTTESSLNDNTLNNLILYLQQMIDSIKNGYVNDCSSYLIKNPFVVNQLDNNKDIPFTEEFKNLKLN